MLSVCLTAVLAPLIGSALVGLGAGWLTRAQAHSLAIGGVTIAMLASAHVFYQLWQTDFEPLDFSVYQWAVIGALSLEIGFLIDSLTVMMMLVVTSVSLLVHVYTIGYMRDDPGYKRFFSYISLFTFAMLMLVMSNNFLQLFFGWEAVGLVSYLLIGFWYTRPGAIVANFKAFLVNRAGDVGFLLGIGAIAATASSLNYAQVFAAAPALAAGTLPLSGQLEVPAITFICIALFIGAMAKSAQIPLHVWLPDSMQGPTPISALIHAATMVTAGIFMVARMSPLFELSETALGLIMMVGAGTAFFMGLVATVEDDIKKVVAYSTLSQLGYMTVALGVSAYSLAIFHLYTHAFFKALLFLAAGSVMIAMHHEQNIRNMGGLRRRMPITYISALIGTLALIGLPGLAGFFSKESIIEAVHLSDMPAAPYVYWMVLAGVFVSAFYALRMFILVFHGRPRMSSEQYHHVHETPTVITVPLIVLAVCSVFAGYAIGPLVYGNFFERAIHVSADHTVMAQMAAHYHGWPAMIAHGFTAAPFYLLLAGAALALIAYVFMPSLPARLAPVLCIPKKVLVKKYGFDWLYMQAFTRIGLTLGKTFSNLGDKVLVDGLLVNGTAECVKSIAMQVRKIQTGFLYQYAFAMITGLLGLLTLFYIQH